MASIAFSDGCQRLPTAAVDVNDTQENTVKRRYCCAACAGSNVMP